MFRINDTLIFRNKECIIIDERYDEGESYFTLRSIKDGETIENVSLVALMREDIKGMVWYLENLIEERPTNCRFDEYDIRLRQFVSAMNSRYLKVYDRT